MSVERAEPLPHEALESMAQPDAVEQLSFLRDEAKKPRPRVLKGYTYHVETPLGTTFVTVNENGGNQPFEVFLNTSKAGSETAAVSEAIGRLISYILRMNSLPDGVAQVLDEYLRREEESDEDSSSDVAAGPPPGQMRLLKGDLCPECGQATVISEEGCRKCYACGYSEC